MKSLKLYCRQLLQVVFLLALCEMTHSCHSPKTQIIAHRGASAYCDENSVEAVKKAVELKSDAIEIDIWRTLDDSIVVFHDRHTRRLTADSLTIPESYSQKLRLLSLPQGGKIPYLREVLECLPNDMTLFVEIKCCWENGKAGNVVPLLKRQLQETGKMDDVAIISFNIEKLKDAKREMPDVPCYWLVYGKDREEEIIREAVQSNMDGIDANAGIVNEKLISLARENNLKVFVWTVDDPTWAHGLIDNFGIDGITTNKPDVIKDCIQ